MRNNKGNNFFLGFFFLINSFLDIRSIVPETIATATLLKYSAGIIMTAVTARYMVVASNEFFQSRQLLAYPSVVSYEYPESDDNFIKQNSEPIVATKKEIIPTLFNQIKKLNFIKKGYKQFKNYQEANKENCYKNWYENKNIWNISNKTYLRAQQARGLFPKINNNYYYNSGNESFWKGFGFGTFVTGTVYHYLDVKNRNKND